MLTDMFPQTLDLTTREAIHDGTFNQRKLYLWLQLVPVASGTTERNV